MPVMQFFKGAACGVDRQLEAKGSGVELVPDAQDFDLEDRVNRRKDVAALCAQRL